MTRRPRRDRGGALDTEQGLVEPGLRFAFGPFQEDGEVPDTVERRLDVGSSERLGLAVVGCPGSDGCLGGCQIVLDLARRGRRKGRVQGR